MEKYSLLNLNERPSSSELAIKCNKCEVMSFGPNKPKILTVLDKKLLDKKLVDEFLLVSRFTSERVPLIEKHIDYANSTNSVV